LRYPDTGAILLCRPSTAGGNDGQMLRRAVVAGQPRLFEHLAALAQTQWNRNGQLGLVVGATYPDEIARVRELAPSLPLLIPGVGAQGGDAEATVRAGWRGDAEATSGPIIVSSSRAVLYAGAGEDFAAAARLAAQRTREQLNRARRG
ncbi:MAG: orotidine 5'-phosphate decarboxylase, partial [Burkholderiaceae bacterium]